MCAACIFEGRQARVYLLLYDLVLYVSTCYQAVYLVQGVREYTQEHV